MSSNNKKYKLDDETLIKLEKIVYPTCGMILLGTLVVGLKECGFIYKVKECSLITISNNEIHIYDNVPIHASYKDSKPKYDITELNDQNWLIYVYGSDASQYSEFIASNIYFDENNKVILDSLKLTDENFEYFVNNENSNDNNSRVRKG